MVLFVLAGPTTNQLEMDMIVKGSDIIPKVLKRLHIRRDANTMESESRPGEQLW
jgi:hypothetical protein